MFILIDKAQFWNIKKVKLDSNTNDKERTPSITEYQDPLFFEKPPAAADIAIRITNLTKVSI